MLPAGRGSLSIQSSFTQATDIFFANMKSAFCYLALASTATIVAAASCTSDVALPWSAVTGGGSDDTCNGDAVCEGLVAEGQCNSLSLIDDEDTTCVQKLKMLKRTVDLSCTSSEKCVAFLDDSLLCLDETTGMSGHALLSSRDTAIKLCTNHIQSGDYHDDVGGNGNAISGVYTAPDGKVQTVTGVSAEPTTTTTATATGDDDRPPGASAARTVSSGAISVTASARSSDASVASSQSAAASQQSQSSSTSQSASTAQQTGAAVQQVVGGFEMLVAAAIPMFMVAL